MSDGNDGKRLERLVRLIEGVLLPAGYTVEVNRRVYEDGVQIAELDIVIKGRIGTGTVRYLIECRDRPSDGAAPGSWIEQLAGRRERMRFDKVMAVSSTGFSEAAKSHAEYFGIELRELAELTFTDVCHFVPYNVPLVVNEVLLTGAKVHLESAQSDEAERVVQKVGNANEKVITNRATGEKKSLLDLWNSKVDKQEVCRGLQVNGDARLVQLVLTENDLTDHFVEVDGSECLMRWVELDGTARVYRPDIPFFEASRYYADTQLSDGRKELVTLVRWKGKETDAIKELSMLFWKDSLD